MESLEMILISKILCLSRIDIFIVNFKDCEGFYYLNPDIVIIIPIFTENTLVNIKIRLNTLQMMNLACFDHRRLEKLMEMRKDVIIKKTLVQK